MMCGVGHPRAAGMRWLHRLIDCLVAACLLLTGPVAMGQAAYHYPAQPGGLRVMSVDAASGRVDIAGGTAQGLKKGQKLCVHDIYQRQIGCFRIRKIAAARSQVRVPRKAVAYIQPGAWVRPAGPGDAAAETGDVEATSFAEPGFVLSPMLPYGFQMVDIDPEASGEDSLLHAGEPVRGTLTGFSFQLETPLTASLGLRTGILAHMFTIEPHASDLDAGGLYKAHHHYGVTGIAVPVMVSWRYGEGALRLILRQGLQWDNSRLKYTMFAVDEAGEKTRVAEALSAINVLSIKSEIGFMVAAGEVSHVSLVLGLALPVMTAGTASVADTSRLSGLTGRDVKGRELGEALAHRRSRVGLSVTAAFAIGY